MPKTDRMPTAGKGVAAVLMAALAWYASDMYRTLMPESTNFGWFNEVNVVIGLVSGWFVIGSRLRRGYSDAIGTGLTGVAALIFWAILIQSCNEMLKLALNRRYEGPVEAIIAVLQIGVEYAQTILHMPLIAVLVGGGIAIGFVAEAVAQRWN